MSNQKTNPRGPVEEHSGIVRVRVNVQLEINGQWVARVPTMTEKCVWADTREEAIKLACEAVSIPEP